ncbi:MAG: hypothetical protein LKI39_02400 [Bacteroides sp.]|jgi:hypothetical protein|nr:hypothetical protein [Bacteroides sp.]MCI1681387.1 hypothetical protein [Bacteroides sp.]
MRSTLLFLIALCSAGCLFGQQDVSKTKELINRIKKSSSYLSAEATLPTGEDAVKTANELLVSEINDWVKAKRNSETVQQVVLQDISSCTEEMNMKRGTNVRAFVYVKKSDIILIHGAGQIVLNDDEKGNVLQALSEISTPLKMEQAPEKKADEKPELKSEVEPIQQVDAGNSLDMIINARTMDEMKTIFADLKAGNAIVYGSYPSSEKLPETYHVLFYTRDGNVKGIVEVQDGKYLELHDKKEVKLSDFSGCGAYWFELK